MSGNVIIMPKLKCTMQPPTTDYLTGSIIIPFAVDTDSKAIAKEVIDKYLSKQKALSVDIKTWRNHRSIDANAYCWKLCTEIANAVGITKEEVYRRNIKEVGVYEPLPIKQEALESFIARWNYKGIGWIVEIVDDSKLSGYKLVHAYYGSSTYNTKEMYRLIEQIKQDAVSVGVSVLSESEESLLLQRWENEKQTD